MEDGVVVVNAAGCEERLAEEGEAPTGVVVGVAGVVVGVAGVVVGVAGVVFDNGKTFAT